jgi:two-component system cell cycle response regulator DivK
MVNTMSSAGSGRKILIVEDHPDMRELLAWQVELMGYKPVAASHAQEGLEKAVVEKPSLILLDIMMPSMDGREAARALRANPLTKDIPILAATALFREADLKSCLEAGCNGYLVKPFTLQELQSKLRELIPESPH